MNEKKITQLVMMANNSYDRPLIEPKTIGFDTQDKSCLCRCSERHRVLFVEKKYLSRSKENFMVVNIEL